MRKLIPGIDIEWLAADLAITVLIAAGEKLVPGFENYADENLSAEKASQGASPLLVRIYEEAPARDNPDGYNLGI